MDHVSASTRLYYACLIFFSSPPLPFLVYFDYLSTQHPHPITTRPICIELLLFPCHIPHWDEEICILKCFEMRWTNLVYKHIALHFLLPRMFWFSL
jgi:hypothetical protein